MKNKRSARARTAPLMFAPLLLGTIAMPALRPVEIPTAERVREKRITQRWHAEQ